MSVAMRSAIAVLGLLFVISVGVAVFALYQKQNLEQQNQSLQTQLADVQDRETKLLAKAKKLEKDQQELSDQLSQKEKEKDELQKIYDDLKTKSDDLVNQLNSVSEERDDWKNRLETIRRERDDLMEKLRSRPEPKPEPVEEPIQENQNAEGVQDPDAAATFAQANQEAQAQGNTDQYWATVLKEKAQLQLDLEKAKSDLDQSALAVAELKKVNSELQVELKNLTDAKNEVDQKMVEAQAEFDRKLKYQEDLTNNLSIEVARSRSGQKNSQDRLDKVKEENIALQNQIKDLTGTKLALEKTIAQINQDKVTMQKKLNETEGVIQGRIDEIWQIKQNLDQKIQTLPIPQSNQQVELPPIIVNANGRSDNSPMTQSTMSNTAVAAKSVGRIISINEANNFVIIDLGENDGSEVGRPLTVYRETSPIGALEVIQVRKDISAADIKQSSIKFKVGDTVRY